MGDQANQQVTTRTTLVQDVGVLSEELIQMMKTVKEMALFMNSNNAEQPKSHDNEPK